MSGYCSPLFSFASTIHGDIFLDALGKFLDALQEHSFHQSPLLKRRTALAYLTNPSRVQVPLLPSFGFLLFVVISLKDRLIMASFQQGFGFEVGFRDGFILCWWLVFIVVVLTMHSTSSSFDNFIGSGTLLGLWRYEEMVAVDIRAKKRKCYY